MKHVYRIALAVSLIFTGLLGVLTILHGAIIAELHDCVGDLISFLNLFNLMPLIYIFSGVYLIGIVLLLIFLRQNKD